MEKNWCVNHGASVLKIDAGRKFGVIFLMIGSRAKALGFFFYVSRKRKQKTKIPTPNTDSINN